MEAAIALPGKIRGLAMCEAPYNSDESARQARKKFRRELKELRTMERAQQPIRSCTQHRTLEGQMHAVSAEALAPLLEFFAT
jgi:hypothetical protein